ncbi:Acetoin catabolism regulatory protein [Rubrivivax sp. A210]|uniref:sigma-54-dependent Fis family transcriptional regulator n=1 Tax=Rubrivivax sp. A210 TaxID=2772301 RepID=UPI001917DCF6|nr:sigma-54-dependent Fis family transcriptional regulator [Rubrivivax sp. A210]CAD5371441.1 Acetoin catabolism regulatory protein [Rubrivivax sp. A210]
MKTFDPKATGRFIGPRGAGLGSREQFAHIERIVDVVSRDRDVPVDSAPDDVIRNSWMRCVTNHRLDPARPRGALVVPAHEVREHLERVDEVLHVARSGMEQLFKHVGSLGYVLLLTDRDGVTIDVISNQPERTLKDAGLYIGSVWSEDRVGTNGVGIAIAEKAPVICHLTDHFDAAHIHLSCNAAPIFDPTGEVQAILNLTAVSSPQHKDSQRLALQLTTMHAKAIEDASFIRRFGNQWILRLGRAWPFAELRGDMMLAFDDDGVIVGANHSARRDVTSGSQGAAGSIIGKSLTEVFKCTMREIWQAAQGAGTDMSLMTADSQNVYYMSVRPPQRKKDPRIVLTGGGQARRASAEDYDALDALAGEDPLMQRMLAKAKRLVDRKVNILIQGETGTGKEMLGRALHTCGERSTRPFIALNCAAIPEALIESELFGYAAGAFTGGRAKGMVGLIQQSDGGTLFLDEIGDMPLQLQTRLLRVLSESEVMPIGGSRPIRVDLTVIAASHRDLRTMIADGRFREDLYYRLCGATLHLPALRERADKEFLVESLLRIEAQETGAVVGISPDALEVLMAHGWPGNIRELRNVLRYATAMSEMGVIRAQDLPAEVLPGPQDKAASAGPRGWAGLAAPAAKAEPVAVPVAAPAVDEGEALRASLRKHRWNITAVAADLGICRATVYRHMKRLHIVPPTHAD